VRPVEALAAAFEDQRRRDVDRLHGVTWSERWLTGPLTRFCGVGLHDQCAAAGATISHLLVRADTVPCLCHCHAAQP
jgi:hypothetical protein